MLEPLSQTEIAFRDTLVTKATGVALDRLGVLFGFPKLGIFERSVFRKALLEVAYGRRGTYRMLFLVLEHLFDQYSQRRGVYNVTLDPANPHALIYREGGAPAFDCEQTGRYIRVQSPTFGSKVYYSQHLKDGVLYLNPIDNPAIAGADWSTLTGPEDATAKVIGFLMQEANPGPPMVDGFDAEGNPYHPMSFLPDNTCTIDLFVDKNIWNVPATYLQEDGTVDRLITAPGQPYGGHLMDLYAAANRDMVEFPGSGIEGDVHPESGDPTGEGPHPIYFDAQGGVAAAFTRIIDALLAAGVHLRAYVLEWCTSSSDVRFNPWDTDFDLGNGPQPLPRAWDFGKHGVPPQTKPLVLEMSAYDDEYFIFKNPDTDKDGYSPDTAAIAVDSLGNLILDSDDLYYLQVQVDDEVVGVQIPPPSHAGAVKVDAGGKFSYKNLTSSPSSQGSEVLIGMVPLAIFSEQEALSLIPGQDNLYEETFSSGSPALALPGIGGATTLYPNEFDLFGEGAAGYFKILSDQGAPHYTQLLRLDTNENGELVTEDGFTLDPVISLSDGVNSIRVTEAGEVFEDAGDGEVKIADLQIHCFHNPKGLFPLLELDHIFIESTDQNQPIEHRRSGTPTAGALSTTAPRGRVQVNGMVEGLLTLARGRNIPIDERNNVLELRRR